MVYKFNILNFDSENVTNAVKLFKAEIHSLNASVVIQANVLANWLNGSVNAPKPQIQDRMYNYLVFNNIFATLGGSVKGATDLYSYCIIGNLLC